MLYLESIYTPVTQPVFGQLKFEHSASDQKYMYLPLVSKKVPFIKKDRKITSMRGEESGFRKEQSLREDKADAN